jgi:hypothetical protein
MKAYDPGSAIISIHVPRCGGTSLREVLAGWFGDRFFIHYFQQNEANPPRHPCMAGSCIHGHFNDGKGIGAADCYPGVDQYIMFLRDPLEAQISNYFFWKRKARARQIKRGDLQPGGFHDYRDIRDFFEKRPDSHFMKYLPRKVYGNNFRDLIEEMYVFVGIAEKMQASVDILAGLLRFPSVSIGTLNEAPRDEKVPDGLRETFIRNNRFVFELYDYCRIKIDEKRY